MGSVYWCISLNERTAVLQHKISGRPYYEQEFLPRSKKGLERKPSKKWLAFLKKQEEDHDRIKVEAKTIWMRMDSPTSDCPLYPECGMSDGAVAAAKRGRQCTMESFACGSNQTRKALRDHERSAKLKGKVTLEADRLREYPEARRRYVELMSELRKTR